MSADYETKKKLRGAGMYGYGFVELAMHRWQAGGPNTANTAPVVRTRSIACLLELCRCPIADRGHAGLDELPFDMEPLGLVNAPYGIVGVMRDVV